MAKATLLYTASIALHVGLAVGVGSLHRAEDHRPVAISITEAKKPKPAEKAVVDAPTPRPPEKSVVQKPRTVAKAPPAEAPAANPAPAPAAAGLGALPDFGLSMSGGSSGLAVAAAHPEAAHDAKPAKTIAAPKALGPAPSPDDACDEKAKKPKAVSVPQPAYPDSAREAGIAGKVRVEITVDAEGNISNVRVLQGLGHGLDEAALEAAKGARFEAATRCGKPVSATFVIGILFSPS